MDSSVIALPLLRQIHGDQAGKRKAGQKAPLYDVIIDLNLDFPGGRTEARERIVKLLEAINPRSLDRNPGLFWLEQ